MYKYKISEDKMIAINNIESILKNNSVDYFLNVNQNKFNPTKSDTSTYLLNCEFPFERKSIQKRISIEQYWKDTYTTNNRFINVKIESEFLKRIHQYPKKELINILSAFKYFII